MSIPLFLISFLGLLIFIVLGIVSKFKKNGKAKRNFIISGACFVIMIVSFASIPTSEADQASTEVKDSANDQEGEDIEKEQSKEPELTEEEKAEIEQAKAEEEAKKKAEEEAKAKAEAEAKAKAEEEARLKAEQEAAARKEKAVANAKEISFPMLDKAANRYAGEPYYIKGEVIQAIEDGNYTIMRINMTQDTYGWTDTVWVEYADITDAVEGSIVELYGEIYGSHTYDTAIGGQMTLPAIMAEELTVLQ